MTNEQILTHSLPDIESFSFEKHPKRFLNKKLIANTLYMIPLAIAVGFLFYNFSEFPWLGWSGLGLWAFILLFSLFVNYKEYFVRGYTLREHDITYRKGWIFHHQITVPFNRIQHTEINHGPIDRLFNLCELEIYTAGGSSSDLSISGLDPKDAQNLKSFVAGKTSTHV
ncbi:hypothetical protein JCM19294_832 [Nonlabens tegetincola]|uniref:Uncharacterized protein n=1 Tax=Nonlabens tegetincola TaxID=323273 RepID=A0A090Q528_9FLAO|nr:MULTISPECIES: PH domain-containing protein [Nonlabens]ALM19845.1 membrane protein [Nonlabens sp. MIC269]MEE2800754.1 PH domain-containing protein [Bacteroidota bacterium]PQJ16994.1 hypothetical protein BST93_09990 [Nonlabens tegetincola]GAK98199.1 hypothetical protein JCM19294_832 [Nonlabens tegetincola]